MVRWLCRGNQVSMYFLLVESTTQEEKISAYLKLLWNKTGKVENDVVGACVKWALRRYQMIHDKDWLKSSLEVVN